MIPIAVDLEVIHAMLTEKDLVYTVCLRINWPTLNFGIKQCRLYLLSLINISKASRRHIRYGLPCVYCNNDH